ncbi:co-chaperone GroES [Apilactobacillus micheneri]|uniref:Co-chaperonin GroES n=1 Tax=Apilactobacillus micheneri TaxID=1899430 RepID=A0ABY2YZS6_9LACO|nr:co-chaperone GroES [Apilactobacillus micheneri]TPR24230.1 co-chaperone GroES [Apilactobacillus micheneri]TPR25249.1 co-chaperone GroES [Apilactobacillus micheneri]TPR27561.1 co-chaperone GroES [Apilactobacillus micheneri]TPR28826.1 co-chaperone GroES [Apilactobacillus micheneri]TPR29848.1 co-chaperone GroES [Apilactobacillus micheneri]
MLKPLGDRVVIETQNEEEKTVGGIVLANNAKEKPQTGKVIAVGSGRILDNGKTLEPSVKAGDKVLFDKYSGTSVDYNGESYLILHDKDIVAIID